MRKLLTATLLMLATTASAKDVLPFIHDDFAGAVSRAQARSSPIFVDTWAPW